MRNLLSLLLLFPLFSLAQGIKWAEGLTWKEIREKAKTENKYIFVDAYATWCAPCKLMDKTVYTVDSVGSFFNEKFISVKVQMDKTGKDDDNIKKWYNDADSIKNKYQVEGYPTFLFFNPSGQVTDKQFGFKQVQEFIAIGKSSIMPGKLYDDPYADYYRKVETYARGTKDYDQYPSMIKIADKLNDTSLSRQLSKELTDYVSALPTKERYTKERIEFWANYTWLSNTRVFGFFYKHARFINRLMNKRNYAESFIDKTIQFEIVLPFLREQAKGSGIAIAGMYMSGPGTKADYSEADWKQLEILITAKFGKSYAKRNILLARVEWYTRHRNTQAVIKYSLMRVNNYPPDVSEWSATLSINGPAWNAFLISNDKKILKGYAKWMKMVIQKWPDRGNYIDTYANLLYKLGHKKDAIEWEQKAIELAPKDESLSITLQQMKKGEPTYLDQGAKWEGIK